MATKRSRKLSSTTRVNYDSKGRITSYTYGKRGQTRNIKTDSHPVKRARQKKISKDGVKAMLVIMLIGGVMWVIGLIAVGVQISIAAISNFFSGDEDVKVTEQIKETPKAPEPPKAQTSDVKQSRSVRGQVF